MLVQNQCLVLLLAASGKGCMVVWLLSTARQKQQLLSDGLGPMPRSCNYSSSSAVVAQVCMHHPFT